eukprot:gene6998-14238_t
MSYFAASGGSLEILQWMRSQYPSCLLDSRLCDAAAGGPHLEVSKLLRGQTPQCPWAESTCTVAAAGEHMEMLKRSFGCAEMAQMSGASMQMDEMDIRLCCWWRPFGHLKMDPILGPIIRGHMDVLKWLRSQDPPFPWNEHTYTAAAEGGHLEVLIWLRSQHPPCLWDWQTCFDAASESNESLDSCFSQARRYNILEWMTNNNNL